MGAHGRVWVWVGAWYALMGLVTFVVYAWDKRAARNGARRVRERTLHVLELMGGWPVAVAAIGLLRHKNRKGRFLLVTGAIVALHGGLWVAISRVFGLAWLGQG